MRKSSICIFLLFLLLSGCSILDLGYTNENGQYVPKRPHFRLKNKRIRFPEGLDTVGVYQLLADPSGFQEKKGSKYSLYLLFYPNGRLLRIVTPLNDSLDVECLNPNSTRCSREYWRSIDGKTIQIESFVSADGFGRYLIFNYVLINSGGGLISVDRDSKRTFKRKTIPPTWRLKYPVDW